MMYIFGAIGNIAMALMIHLERPNINGKVAIVSICIASALSAVASVHNSISGISAFAGSLWLLLQHFGAALINSKLNIVCLRIVKQAQTLLITLMWFTTTVFVTTLIISISGTIKNGGRFIDAFQGNLFYGVINLAGYPNRLLLLLYLIWVLITSYQLNIVRKTVPNDFKM